MNESVKLFMAWLEGGALGAIFFGGLWWTVRKGVSSTRPALWFFSSLILRMIVVVGGFYLLSGGHFKPLAASLFGFILARFVVMRLTRPSIEDLDSRAKEASHAP